MTVLLGGAIEIPWYFYVLGALAILGMTAALLLPATIPLALANPARRRGEVSAGKLTAKYTLAGVLPAAYLGAVAREGRLVLLVAVYVVAWRVAYSSMSAELGRKGPKASAGR